MSKTKLVVPFLLLCLLAASEKPVYAMHIMEGFLSPSWSIIWGAASLPFVVLGFMSIKKSTEENPKTLIILALCAAFAFVLSALKIPSVTGSSSHPTGVGLCAILFGPLASSVVSTVVLLFQALLLAHGGLTTLGANVFSMGIAGPFIAYILFKLSLKLNIKSDIAVFIAAFAGDMATYCVTSSQLALAFNQNGFMPALIKFMGVFSITQIPLAVCEGLLTVAVFNIIKKYRAEDLRRLISVAGARI